MKNNTETQEDVAPWMPDLNLGGIKKVIMGIKGNFVIPAMPQLIIELDGLMNEKYPNVKQFAAIIEDNPVVTGDILGNVNSVIFQSSLKNKIEIRNINQCLSLFGVEKVYQMAVASAVKGVSYDDPVIDKIIATSGTMANICAIISSYTEGQVSTHVAYLYGLFMHGGMIVLALQPNTSYKEIFEKGMKLPGHCIIQEQSDLNGARHDYLGVAVARRWGVGMHPNNETLHKEDMSLLLAIQEQHHEHFHAISNDLVRNLIAIGNLAHYLTGIVFKEYQSNVLNELSKQSIALLGLSDSELSELKRKVSQMMFSSE